MKVKIRSYGEGATDFHARKIPEADSNYVCCWVILIDSLLKNGENYYPQVLSKKYNYIEKERKTVYRCIYWWLKVFFYYSSESGEKKIKHHIMISFLKRKRFIKAKIIDYYLSNGRDTHQNYCAIILKNIKYRQSSIKYIIIYISYLQISSNIIRHIIQYIIIISSNTSNIPNEWDTSTYISHIYHQI